jgi:hypothetical protein
MTELDEATEPQRITRVVKSYTQEWKAVRVQRHVDLRWGYREIERKLKKLEDKNACGSEGNYTVKIAITIPPDFPALF